jgi:hypothetical protein
MSLSSVVCCEWDGKYIYLHVIALLNSCMLVLIKTHNPNYFEDDILRGFLNRLFFNRICNLISGET